MRTTPQPSILVLPPSAVSNYILEPASELKPTNLSLIFETLDTDNGVCGFINHPNATTGIQSF